MPLIDIGGIKSELRIDLQPFNNALARALASSKTWAATTGKVAQSMVDRQAKLIATRAKAQNDQIAAMARAVDARITAQAKAAATRAQAASRIQNARTMTRVTAPARAEAIRVRAYATAPAQADAIRMKAEAVAPAQAEATIIRAEGAAEAARIRAEGAAKAAMARALKGKSAAGGAGAGDFVGVDLGRIKADMQAIRAAGTGMLVGFSSAARVAARGAADAVAILLKHGPGGFVADWAKAIAAVASVPISKVQRFAAEVTGLARDWVRAAAAMASVPLVKAQGALGAFGSKIASSKAGRAVASAAQLAQPLVEAAGTFGSALARAAAVGAGAVRQHAPTMIRSFASIGANFGRAITSAMASAARSVAASFRSVIKGVASGFLNAAGRVGSAFKNAIGGALKLTGVSGFLKGAAVVGEIGFSAREAMNMETRIYQLGRVTALSGEKLRELTDHFKEMASVMPGVHLEDIFNIGEMGAKLGVEGKNLRVFTRDVSKMSAVLTDIPLEEAVTGIARLQSVFHSGADETIKFASVLNRLDLESTASARDILNISQRMAGFASMAGMSAQQTMSLAAALRQAGVPIETAGTSIGQILQRMGSTKDMAQFAKMAGMTRREFEKLIRVNPFESIRAVAKGLGGMDFLSASRALEKVHLDGQRVRGTELALGRVLKILSGYIDDANQEWQTQGSILGSYNAQANTTASQLTRLWNNVELLHAAMGRPLLAVIKSASETLSSFAETAKSHFEANEKVTQKWADGVSKWIGYASLVFTNWPDVIGLATVKGEEELLKFTEVARRVGGFLKDSFVGTAKYLMDVLPQVFDNISVRMENSFKDAASNIVADMRPLLSLVFDEGQLEDMAGLNFRRKVPKVDFNRGAMNLLGPAMKAQEFFGRGGIFKDLIPPDKQKELDDRAKPFRERLDKAKEDQREALRKRREAIENEGRPHAAHPGPPPRARMPVQPFPDTARGRAAAQAAYRRAFNRAARGLPPVSPPVKPKVNPWAGEEGGIERLAGEKPKPAGPPPLASLEKKFDGLQGAIDRLNGQLDKVVTAMTSGGVTSSPWEAMA